jgi:carbohydrate kinase (thermoresistant glucokinase family)
VVIVILGPAGSGKTTVGRALASAVGWRFVDADDFHTPAAIAHMRAGIALTDAERAPWLASLHHVAAATIDRRGHLVLACSALKERYRATLRGDLRGVRFVYLKADEQTLGRRLADRSGHFAGAILLASQLADLEEPADALTVDATAPPEQIVEVIRREIGL